MPNSETFQCRPIKNLVECYAQKAKITVDPFARNSKIGNITNDLNPETEAMYHLDALDFLKLLKAENTKADLIFLDPPYSLRQMKDQYQNIGRKITGRESRKFYGDLRDAAEEIVSNSGIVISFGWNSIGMGKTRGFEIVEILLVCHGRAHNDTICTVDKRIQPKLI